MLLVYFVFVYLSKLLTFRSSCDSCDLPDFPGYVHPRVRKVFSFQELDSILFQLARNVNHDEVFFVQESCGGGGQVEIETGTEIGEFTPQ